jgi:site-specific DNA recombinase
MTKKRLRCAVYTRKSTDEGLDQDFNSLDAQREACEAYIKSQLHEGWTLLRDRYDDGGYSGATMNRPALSRLLQEVRAGRVDVIVVYKVDRLTRALSDFARLVETFDSQSISFVSVTQQFNTTTSMGRLTLNVLLSFAQFEREVTAERIRDKIGASKKKGMWMGGVVPLGYDAAHKKLVVNKEEAETVRTIFRLYLERGTVARVKDAADQMGLRTKPRKPNNGTRSGGDRFTRGHIYKLLANPIYAGEVFHKGQHFPGEHEGIIERETWEQVQAKLRENGIERGSTTNSRRLSILAGLLFHETGERLSPSYASKSGRRYRYYVSRSEAGDSADERSCGLRLPAAEIEGIVIRETAAILGDPSRVLEAVGATCESAERVSAITRKAASLGDQLLGGTATERNSLLRAILTRVEVGEQCLRFVINRRSMAEAIGAVLPDEAPDGGFVAVFEMAATFKRRGVEMKLVLGDTERGALTPDPVLIDAVSKGHAWLEQLKSGQVASARALAEKLGRDRADLGKTLRLAFLAPDIVEAIFSGRQPVTCTVSRLRRLSHLPLAWAEQRKLLGFDA